MLIKVEKCVENEFGEKPDEIIEVEEGIQLRTFRFRMDDGWYIIQFAKNQGSSLNMLRKGAYWYKDLQLSEVPVPRIISDGVQQHEGDSYAIFESIDGETASEDISKDRVKNAGECLARIHDARDYTDMGFLELNEEGDLEISASESYKVWISEMFDESIQRFETHGFKLLAEELTQTRAIFQESIPTDFEPVICHNDYSADNVIFDGDRVTGIIDFDLAYVGHNHRDIAKGANGFWMHDPGADWNVREAFYEGYKRVRDLDDAFDKNEPLYRFETHVGTISHLLEMDLLSEYEQNFYHETILDAREYFLDSCEM